MWVKETMGRGSNKKRDGEREGRREREREREGEGGERCDFLVSLYDKIGNAQVVVLAHIYVGGQGLLTRYGPCPIGVERKCEN
jgi:hypothetical protein